MKLLKAVNSVVEKTDGKYITVTRWDDGSVTVEDVEYQFQFGRLDSAHPVINPNLTYISIPEYMIASLSSFLN